MTADLNGYLREKAKDTVKSNVVSLKVILEKAKVSSTRELKIQFLKTVSCLKTEYVEHRRLLAGYAVKLWQNKSLNTYEVLK